MGLVLWSGMDAVAYILILYSVASMVFLWTMVLINVYDRAMSPPTKPIANGHARGEEAQLQDANEFELDGLMSDDEDEGRKLLKKVEGADDDSIGSPSTVGRNSQRMA